MTKPFAIFAGLKQIVFSLTLAMGVVLGSKEGQLFVNGQERTLNASPHKRDAAIVVKVDGKQASKPGPPQEHAAGKVRAVPIQLQTSTGKLDGTLDLPAGEGPFPVVIIHVGSGPTDRDGNQRPHLVLDCNKRLGQALAQRGIAVLRYDRRGLGKSAAAWSKKDEEFRFEILVDDLADWVKLLRNDRRFSRIGIVGHSQGSLVGILAAQKVKVDAFVSLAGVGRKTHEALIEQYSKNLPALIGVARARPLAKKAEHIVTELAAGRTVVDVPKELAEQGLGPAVQPFLISLFKYDPAVEIAKLKIPILILEGTRDRQLRMSDLSSKIVEGKLLAAANKSAELCLIDDMNHWGTTDSWQSLVGNLPLAPLAPGLVEKMSAFLQRK